MHVAIRVAGCGFVIVGVVLLLTAMLSSSDRLITGIVAALGILIGVACFLVKPIEASDIEALLDGKPAPRRDGTYVKRK